MATGMEGDERQELVTPELPNWVVAVTAVAQTGLCNPPIKT